MQKHERKTLIANRLYKAATNCPKTKVKIAEECGIDVRKFTDYLNGKHNQFCAITEIERSIPNG